MSKVRRRAFMGSRRRLRRAPAVMVGIGIVCLLLTVAFPACAEKDGAASKAPIDGPRHVVMDLSQLTRVGAGQQDRGKSSAPEAHSLDEAESEIGYGVRASDGRTTRSPIWRTVRAEGFEGAFPADWQIFTAGGAADAYWDDASGGRVHSGSWSGYCADGGSAGAPPPGPYAANMNAWMVYGPFTLHDATDAELEFWHWTLTESGFDDFSAYVSIDGSNWYGYGWSGDQGGWKNYTLDLSNVHTLGNVCGQRQVWIAFNFTSDSSVQYEGTYIDDIVLRKEGKNWTVAVYLAADNTLGGSPALTDIDEMEAAMVSSMSDCNVIVLYDDVTSPDTTLFWIQPDATEGSYASYVYDQTCWNIPAGWAFTYPATCQEGFPSGGGTTVEHDMGSQSTLTSFYDWVLRNFCSDQYALILWNHGGGWEPKNISSVAAVDIVTQFETGAVWERKFWPTTEPLLKKDGLLDRSALPTDDRGVCWDDTSGTYLSIKQVANAIENSTRSWADIVGFDACLMQMLEVAYELASTPSVAADFIVASEESEWGNGWAYHQILAGISSSTSSLGLATTWGTTRTAERFAAGGLDTISTVDAWAVPDLADAVSALATRLSNILSSSTSYHRILFSKLIGLCFASNEFLDLGNFCAWLSSWFWGLGDATTGNLADAVLAEIGSTVIATSNGTGYGAASGVSVYMPDYHDIAWGATHGNYTGANFAFCNDHSWDEFINAWLATDYADPYESNNTPATAYNRGTFRPNVTYLCSEADFDDSTADWYRFTLPYPCHLTVWAWCTERNSDTVIYLYDSLANAQADNWFASDDDGIYYQLGMNNMGSYYSSSSALPAGTFYVKVVPCGSYMTNADYQLWISSSVADTPAAFRVDALGGLFADGTVYGNSFASGNADIAEWVNVCEPVEPGDVLELDPAVPGAYRKSRGSCSPYVAGVVSTAPGVILGSAATDPSSLITGPPLTTTPYSLPTGHPSPLITGPPPPTTHYPLPTESALLALLGIVPVKACDEGGPIEPGDLLVTASRSGYLRREDPGECAYVVGKALEALSRDEGLILVLLTR